MTTNRAGPFPATAVASACGITYRRLDYWSRQGYLDIPSRGSGHPRDLTQDQATAVGVLAALVAAGLEPQVAAEVAKTSGRRTGRVIIELDTEAIRADLLQKLETRP